MLVVTVMGRRPGVGKSLPLRYATRRIRVSKLVTLLPSMVICVISVKKNQPVIHTIQRILLSTRTLLTVKIKGHKQTNLNEVTIVSEELHAWLQKLHGRSIKGFLTACETREDSW